MEPRPPNRRGRGSYPHGAFPSTPVLIVKTSRIGRTIRMSGACPAVDENICHFELKFCLVIRSLPRG